MSPAPPAGAGRESITLADARVAGDPSQDEPPFRGPPSASQSSIPVHPMAASLEPSVAAPGALAATPPAHGSALPVQLTGFVGRAAEIRQVWDLLGRTRLLTLTGPGGSGKTRLALEVAREVERDGEIALWWVELAPLADPALVPQEVTAALRLVEEPGRSPMEALIGSIGARHALLVLDNCEHLVEACARLGDRLLRGCPNLTILATSREALGVAGETAWLVPPLSLPAPADPLEEDLPARSEAVALFVERARAVAPDFAVSGANAAAVAGICRKLDGVPLALELAAARLKVLTPAQILARLDDCFSLLVQRGRTTLPRHQTIRATIDWSYRLLSAPERLLLQRLSVFAGGFSLDAAEAVCAGGEIEGGEVLDLVAALVERSLVGMREQDDRARYHLLEVVRQYAAERLVDGDAEAGPALARHHAGFYAGFAEAAGPRLDVVQAPETMAEVTADHDNLRAALDWALRAGEASLALRIAGGLAPYWLHGAHWSDGLEWMTKVLEPAAPRSDPALGKALQGAASLAYAVHELERARGWAEAAERLWGELASPRHLALAHASLAQLRIHLGDSEAALRHAHESVRHARASGDPFVLAFCLATGLGFVHAFRGEAGAADGYCAEAQGIALREQYQWGILVASFSRAMTAWMHGDVEAAALHALPCLLATRRVGNPWFEPRVLLVPAGVGARRGEPRRAARLLAVCDALQASSRGGRLLPVEQPYFERIVEDARAALGEDAFARAWEEGRALRLEQALDEAEALVRGSAPPPTPAAMSAPAPSPAPAPPPAGPPEPDAAPGEALRGADLRVRALGPLEIHRGDELLGTEHWSYAKPRELLLYLLCHPRGATKEQIGRAIWPEATPSQVRNNLHVTLHYLRKALGASEWVVYGEDRYRLDDGCGVEFDYEVFEAAAARILADPEAADEADLREALRLYRGGFLDSEAFGAWHLEWRDRAQGRYVELLSLLAERCFEREEYAEAKRLYRELVAREELREDLQRRLMQCLARTGERAHALRHGERLAALLREELGAEPEPETAELCERLRRAERV
jgi:predicted ATPase/DNA-binding SARP family transcriptional activator